MKKLLFMLFVLLLALTGCGGNDSEKSSGEVKNEVKEEKQQEQPEQSDKELIQSYYEEMNEYYNAIGQFGVDFEALKTDSANGEIDDATFGERVFTELIPVAADLVVKVEAVKVPTDELKEIHEKTIAMLNKNHQALSEIVSAVQAGDFSKITSANQMLEEARKIEREVADANDKLAAKYGVE